MKIFRLILSAAILWGFAVSCNNEIDLYPDDAPKMLYVLGCLDGTGGLQEVKIRKMIAGNLNGNLMINDPAYYLPDTSIRVYLEEASGKRYPLNRVIHSPQTGGAFSQDSNLVYEIAGYRPLPGKPCILRIEDPANGKVLSAQVTTMKSAGFSYPDQESVLRRQYDFTDLLRPFHVEYLREEPASVLTVSMKYVDVMINGDNICRKANYSCPPDFISPEGAEQYVELGKAFPLSYLWLIFDRSIHNDPEVDFRMFYRFDFTLWTGDSAIANYLYYAEKFTDNRKQYFNNIDGGMGLFFATSHGRLIDVCPKERFLSYLATNDTTAHLKFSRFPYLGIYTDPDSTMVNPFFSRVR